MMLSEGEESGEDEEKELSQEDKELIEIYGPKIRVVKWSFENDKEFRKFYPKGFVDRKKDYGKPMSNGLSMNG